MASLASIWRFKVLGQMISDNRKSFKIDELFLTFLQEHHELNLQLHLWSFNAKPVLTNKKIFGVVSKLFKQVREFLGDHKDNYLVQYISFDEFYQGVWQLKKGLI